MNEPERMAERIRELEEEVAALSDEIEVLERNQLTAEKKDQYQQAKAGWGILGFCAGTFVGFLM